MRFLVIGCGSIGRRHIANLRALGATKITAFDMCPKRRQAVAGELEVHTVADLEEAWRQEPQVVLVAVPTALHVPLALEAAEKGCHLFIEKPLSDSWSAVESLVRRVRQNELISLVGCNLRFHPGLATVKQLLDENAIGSTIAVRVEFGQYLPDWRPQEDYRRSYSARRALGGGVILDAIHEIDYIRWLVGEVASATCMAAKLSRLETDTEDTAAILLRFQSGAFGEVHVDYVQRSYSRTCQVIGDEGTIHWDYTAGQVRRYSAHDRQWRVFADPPGWAANQMYVDEMAHFLRCLVGREKPALDVAEGARVLQVALAAKESALQQRWIEIGGNPWTDNPG